jgi:hypothetical protein
VIWEPFVLALVLGLIISAGLYFAYLWPSVEPTEEPAAAGDVAATSPGPAPNAPSTTSGATAQSAATEPASPAQ